MAGGLRHRDRAAASGHCKWWCSADECGEHGKDNAYSAHPTWLVLDLPWHGAEQKNRRVGSGNIALLFQELANIAEAKSECDRSQILVAMAEKASDAEFARCANHDLLLFD